MHKPSFLDRFSQDRIFWLVVGVILLAFVLLNARLSASILISLAALLVAITIHECSHAWVASLLGDPTARLQGRVTLNPLRHLDPLGTVMMLVTTFTGLGIGWGKPVPVTPYRLKPNPRLGNGIVALSGPASNLLLGSVLAFLLRFVYSPAWLVVAIRGLALINLVIGFFNLIPLPPLDGNSVLIGLLSLSKSRWAFTISEALYRMSRYGPILLFGLIFVAQLFGLNVFGWLAWAPAQALYHAMAG